MSAMPIVDSNGLIVVETGSLKPAESDLPVWKARNDVALPAGEWLYGGTRGHNLNRFKRSKATLENAQSFEKEALLYLNGYGPDIADQLIKRGEASFSINITKDSN